MSSTSRRTAVRCLLTAPFAAPAILAAAKPTDVRIKEMRIGYEDFLYRTPIKFGGNEVDRVTLLNVNCKIESRDGKIGKGFGSMPMGNVWSFPSKKLKYADTLGAMKQLAVKMQDICEKHASYGHPVDLNEEIEPLWLAAAKDIHVGEPIPKLCVLVTGSPFDAALNDAYGKMLNRSSFAVYDSGLMTHDLSHYLGSAFKGEYLQQYVNKTPKASMPLYHLVGAVDPLTEADIRKRVGDGLPETLPEWIRYSGLTHLKIKLNGEDVKWDSGRVLDVDRITAETQAALGKKDWVYSLDFNEKCPNVKYLIDFLNMVKAKSPAGFARIQYVEQPTKRDLQLDRANVMHEASKIRPVVIDESLTGVDALMLAREMGYTGAALKACKGQSQALLVAAAAQKHKMFLCVQDLTCPGASLIHSASLAAHVPGVAAIEANARQYVPSANKGWEKRFPGIFDVRDGKMNTALLNKPGLGAV